MLQLSLVLIALSIIPLIAIWRGFVLAMLWAWFLVPMGAPSIGIPMAIGVSLIVGMLTASKYENKKNSAEETANAIGYVVLSPLLALGVGWVVKQFLT